MKKLLLISYFILISFSLFSQKTVYIPQAFSSDAALRNWSYSRSYQSANFVVFWGSIVGTNPATYSDANLRFNPQAVCDTLEKSYTKYIKEIKFCSDDPAKPLGKYKIIIVMNDTWTGGGPSGWAFGGQYEGVIGAMWVHPGATRDGGVVSHEFAHALQGQNSIQENTVGGGFTGSDATGFFWECHANFMRTQVYPRFAGDDMPRWMGTSMFHWSSTRHHYASFRVLIHMQQLDGITMVNRLWRESVANEHPLITYRRLKGWNQSQLNDFMYDYAKREVALDYTVNNFGAIMRGVRNQLKNNEPHYMWRTYTILKQISATNGRYVVPDAFAPQDYGYNLIPLYSTCSNKSINIKFKGHTEVNSTAGWRYGFVAVKSDGTISRYSPVYSANESEISFQLASGESQMYLVVIGAPTSHTSYVWEAGWPKIKRYPYELSIANGAPEGYQSDFRSAYKTNGSAHSNGGGWVSANSSVAASVYVGPKAVVRNSNISGNVKIDGTAWVENATVRDNVVINGNANIWGGTYSGSAQITDNTVTNNTSASGNAVIKGDALLFGDSFGGSVTVGGDAEIASCAAGVYLQFPHSNNGRSNCDGKGAGDATNQDVNAAYTQFSDAQMAFSSPVSCTGTGIPTPAFSATPTTLCNSGTVVFTDESTNTPTSWLWDFGNGQTSTVKNPSANYTSAGSYTVKLTATNASGSNSLTKTNYITVSSNCSAYLPRTGWSIKSFDSQETSGENGAATNVLDGNNATIWHTQWAAASNPGYPHEIQIDIKSNYSVTGLAYLPRQDGVTNGTIAGYQVYVSTDGSSWSTAVTSGTWANNKNEKVVNFTAKTGRYVRLVATSEVSNNIWASAAEINVIGTAASARIGFENKASQNDNGIKVFPNPAGATFTVELSNFSPKENVTLHIYDAASGKEIIKNELGKTRTAFINVSSDKGKGTIYFIKAASNTKVVTKKLIITR